MEFYIEDNRILFANEADEPIMIIDYSTDECIWYFYSNNKIENIFQKVFPKHIKKTMRTETRLLKRFNLKLEFWNINNKN